MSTQQATSTSAVTDLIHRVCVPLHGEDNDYNDLLDAVGDRSLVLLGEATHGTHDFYRERARITQRLIEERGFVAVAVEGDWPDAYRINRYVTGASSDETADQALCDFVRFPSWMWRNRDVAEFINWQRAFNASKEPPFRTRFYGLDLYSMNASMDAVISYLDRVDPAAADRARERYSCFGDVGGNGQSYGARAHLQLTPPCENEVIAQVIELHHSAAAYNGWVGRDELFFAEQNAHVVLSAERYYREMFTERASSWNLRDLHMADTLDALLNHLRVEFGEAKIVLWEHNSHVGDARATTMNQRHELNVGQVVRQRYGADNVLLVGFTTHDGTVTAASDWGGDAERKRVRDALPGSVESLLHDVGLPRFSLQTRTDETLANMLRRPRLHRAIGVIYRPESELISHYLETHLTDQFDVVIHVDHTVAVTPLERSSVWDRGEAPETYPTGL
jgi:erythromycin esterase-like protein